MDKLPITAAGHAALEAEFLHRQQVERPRIIAAIAEARSHGDLSENAEYHSAKEAQSHNEGRIVELEDLLQRADFDVLSSLQIQRGIVREQISQLEHIEAIERQLWSAADMLRANSNYAANEYFMREVGSSPRPAPPPA